MPEKRKVYRGGMCAMNDYVKKVQKVQYHANKLDINTSEFSLSTLSFFFGVWMTLDMQQLVIVSLPCVEV